MEVIEHATCVAIDQKGLLIKGSSGSGKSGLAFELLALGAKLVADDRTRIKQVGDQLIATAPDALKGQIEARGVGILAAPFIAELRLHAAIDLDQSEAERIPQKRNVSLLNCELPLLYRATGIPLAPILIHYMRYGRSDCP